MPKTLVTGTSLVLTLAACATVSPTREVGNAAALASAPAAQCVSDTATRIPLKPDQCAGFERTYTREDLVGTGQRDLAEALLMLDPAVTVHRR